MEKLHVFRIACLTLLLGDLLLQMYQQGVAGALVFRLKHLNSWALSLSLLYFYWVTSFEPHAPATRRKYSTFILNLQTLNISLHSVICVIYWSFLHKPSNIENAGGCVFFWFRFAGVGLLAAIDFLWNDLPVRLGSRKFILPLILAYLPVNLYFTISEGVPVYPIISWVDWKTPLVFLGCILGMYGAFFLWLELSRKLAKKTKCD